MFYVNYWEHDERNPLKPETYNKVDVYGKSGGDRAWFEEVCNMTDMFEEYDTVCCWLGVNDVGTVFYSTYSEFDASGNRRVEVKMSEVVDSYTSVYEELLGAGKNVIIYNVPRPKYEIDKDKYLKKTNDFGRAYEEGWVDIEGWNEDLQKSYDGDKGVRRRVDELNNGLKEFYNNYDGSGGKLKYVDVCKAADGNELHDGHLIWLVDGREAGGFHYAYRPNRSVNGETKTINDIWGYMLEHMNFTEGMVK